MKKLFSVQTKYLNHDIALLVGRIAFGVLMLSHGLPKMQMLFSGGPIYFPTILGMTEEVTLAHAAFAEVFCSVLILLGFATRLAAVPVIITMLIATFSIHAGDPFVEKERAILYLVGYGILFLAGAGKYSVDHLLSQKSKSKVKPQLKAEPEDPTFLIYH